MTENHTSTKLAVTKTKESQGQKLSILLLCLLTLIAVALTASLVPKADALNLDDGGFCIASAYGDEGITGVHGPTYCQMSEPEPENPEAVDTLTVTYLTPNLPGVTISWPSMPSTDTYTGTLTDIDGRIVYTANSSGWYQTIDYWTVRGYQLTPGDYSFTMTHDATGRTSEAITLTVLTNGITGTTK